MRRYRREYRGVRFAEDARAKQAKNYLIQASTDLTYAAKYMVKATEFYTQARISLDRGEYKRAIDEISRGLGLFGNADSIIKGNQFVHKSHEAIRKLDEIES